MTLNWKEFEEKIEYSFRDKAFLHEALTHPSCGNDPSSSSYQRQEFVGDAVLDHIVVSRLSENNFHGMVNNELRLAKAALVNADFLSFLCLELSVTRRNIDVMQNDSDGSFHTVTTARPVHLWQYMRHHHPAIVTAQRTCIERHSQLRGMIIDALDRGASYPWVEAAQLESPLVGPGEH
jgi:dsRNA-specific ribonuclease